MHRYAPLDLNTQRINRVFDNCKRVAICLYGEYRTGDFCLQHYKNLASWPNDVQVDFFCSTKTTGFSHNLNHDHLKSSTHEDEYDAEMLKSHILNNTICPKMVNVITTAADIASSGMKWGRLYNSIGDALNLKNIYENQHSLAYDIVLVSRYDCLIHPTDIIERIINWHNTVDWQSLRYNFNNPAYTNILSTDSITRTSNTGFMGSQDIFFWGTGFATDLLYAEILNLLSQFAKKHQANVNREPLIEQTDGHIGITKLSSNAGIGVSHCWPVLPEDGGLDFLYDIAMNNDKYKYSTTNPVQLYDTIEISLVRSTYNTDDKDPGSLETLLDAGQHWISNST